jgi:protein involved in polysaccharide export with SLBB domain
MKEKTTILFLFISVLFGFNSMNSQSFNDFSNVNFSELSDGEIDLLLRRATAQGYTQFDLLKMARAQGFTQADIENLDKRFKSAQTIARIAESATAPLEETRLRKQWLQNLEVFRETDSDVFGYNVFRGTSFLSFQSNLNLPTPDDYIVGAGDKLFIDIYGQSEAYYQAEISPEGYAILENIGPVNLNGLEIKDARNRLIQRFKKVYNGIGQNKTFINVSVGIPRAIRINITGEVQLPGTYNFSAFNTLYNALYVAGGITENATLRNIKLYRNNKLISSVDVYKFLTGGDESSNIRLENNDLIVVEPYGERVSVQGSVKIPGRFEMKNGETLSDLIFYAGGFSENAYRKSIKVTRIFDNKLKVVDVDSDQFEFFNPKAGDKIEIDSVVQKYQDRIILKGSVYRPGIYSLNSVKNVKDLILRAEGVKPDTYLEKAYITRTNNDLTTSNIQFNVYDQINDIGNDLELKEEDVVTIFSKNDLRDETYIEISGEVKNPGIYPFSSNLNLSDLIIIAGGLKKNATLKNIEISRTNYSSQSIDNSAEVFYVDIESMNSDSNFEIKPFDNIIIRKDPLIEQVQFARIEGEVKYPGRYAISSKKERISDLLNRAGGPNEYAYNKGATLIRKTEFAEESNQIQNEIEDLTQLKEKLLIDSTALTESEKLLISRIDKNLVKLNEENNSNQDFSSFVKKERISEIVKRNAMDGDIPLAKSESIGINLDQILKNPGLKSDLLIEDGDIIIIPKKLETVRLRGELLYPTTVRHSPSRGLKYYINSAGGFDLKAKRSSTYVVYANGDVARTKKFLFFNLYPKAEPGCEVIVPKKSDRNPLAVSQILNFTTGLAALILAINQIN